MANQNNDRRGRRRKSDSRRIIERVITFAVAAFVLILGVAVGVAFFWVLTAPEVTEADLVATRGSTLVDQNGEEVYTLGGTKQESIEYKEIPEVLEAAVLSIEDQRFYDHLGVDPIRLAGAVVANLRDGYGSQGGSTITQQLVKLSVFSTTEEDQNLKRKVQEAWLALKLERNYSKEQILTMYVNKVYMSDNIYGMGTASEYYYGKPADQLELHEAAQIAGMPQLPNTYNPYTNPEDATNRRNTVLYQMEEAGYITEEQANEATSLPITTGLDERKFTEAPNLVIDSYVKEVLAEIEEKTDIDPYNAGATIHTNIDIQSQQFVYNVLNSEDYIAFPDEDFQSAVTIVDVETGQVKAIGGGRNAEEAMGYNRATELDRSIGSTMKPLSVYGPLIENEQYSTYHQVVDEPYEFPTGDTLENVDNSYQGQISMREALVESRNIPTAKFFEKVGLDRAEEFLAQIGIENMNDGNGLYWSNSIGGEVTPYQLAGSYAAFANEGQYTEPYTVSRIVMPDGVEIDLRPESVQAMSDYTAYMVTDMLKDSAETYNQLDTLTASGIPHAGKTGTTNYSQDIIEEYGMPSSSFPDRWYAGYTSDYSVSVWTGYDKQLEEGNWLSFYDPSGYIALHIYNAIMSELSQRPESTNEDWVMPDSVVPYNIVDGSNPPREASSGGVTELFVRGNEPGDYSTDDLAERNNVRETPQRSYSRPETTTESEFEEEEDSSSSEGEDEDSSNDNSEDTESEASDQESEDEDGGESGSGSDETSQPSQGSESPPASTPPNQGGQRQPATSGEPRIGGS